MMQTLWLVLLALSLTVWNPEALDPTLNIRLLFQSMLLVLSGIILSTEIKKRNLSVSRLELLTFLTFVLYLLYAFTGIFRGSMYWSESFFEWLKMANYIGLSFTFMLLFRSGKMEFQSVAKTIVTVSSFSYVIAVWQYLNACAENGLQPENADAVKSVFANKNIFAELIPAFVGVQALILLEERQKLWRSAAFIGLAFSAFLVLITISRNVWLAISVMALVFVVRIIASESLRKKLITKQFLFPIIGALLLLFVAGFIEKNTLQHFFNYRNTAHERAMIWRGTFLLFQEHPLFGIGTGSWKIDIMKMQSLGIRGFATFFQQPHNDYLWVLSEQGAIGFLIGLMFVALLLFNFWQQRIHLARYNLLTLCLCYFASYAIISIFAFPRERIEHNTMLAIFTGLLLAASSSHNYFSLKNYYRWLATLILIMGISGSVVAIQRLRAEANLVKVLEAKNMQNWSGLLSKIPDAENLFYHYDGVATPVRWYSGLAHFNQNNIAAAEADFYAALPFNPYHPFTLSNLGTCEELQGHHAKALEYLNEALQYAPGFPDAVLNRAAIEFQSGHELQAAETFATISDTASSPRFETFRSTLVNAMIDSLSHYTSDSVEQQVYNSLRVDRTWQLQIIKKAQHYHRSFAQQMQMDMLYCSSAKKNLPPRQ
ncbi:MAG: O-antigen ligase family protein [Chitinophagales bacterium]